MFFKKKKNKRITKIVKIAKHTYNINDSVIVKIKQDGNLEINYDPKLIKEDNVNNLIDEFLNLNN